MCVSDVAHRQCPTLHFILPVTLQKEGVMTPILDSFQMGITRPQWKRGVPGLLLSTYISHVILGFHLKAVGL